MTESYSSIPFAGKDKDYVIKMSYKKRIIFTLCAFGLSALFFILSYVYGG